MDGNEFKSIINRLRIAHRALKESRQVISTSKHKVNEIHSMRIDVNYEFILTQIESLYNDMFSQVKIHDNRRKIDEMNSETLRELTEYIEAKCNEIDHKINN